MKEQNTPNIKDQNKTDGVELDTLDVEQLKGKVEISSDSLDKVGGGKAINQGTCGSYNF